MHPEHLTESELYLVSTGKQMKVKQMFGKPCGGTQFHGFRFHLVWTFSRNIDLKSQPVIMICGTYYLVEVMSFH